MLPIRIRQGLLGMLINVIVKNGNDQLTTELIVRLELRRRLVCFATACEQR
jgi:hypothetical protein